MLKSVFTTRLQAIIYFTFTKISAKSKSNTVHTECLTYFIHPAKIFLEYIRCFCRVSSLFPSYRLDVKWKYF